jgi:hypothetical protein
VALKLCRFKIRDHRKSVTERNLLLVIQPAQQGVQDHEKVVDALFGEVEVILGICEIILLICTSLTCVLWPSKDILML